VTQENVSPVQASSSGKKKVSVVEAAAIRNGNR